jgi:hypothetical protein
VSASVVDVDVRAERVPDDDRPATSHTMAGVTAATATIATAAFTVPRFTAS